MHTTRATWILLAAAGWLSIETPSAAGWPTTTTDPLPLCLATGDQYQPIALPDGTGGTYVAWLDKRNNAFPDVYMIRLLADGTPAPGWPAGGLGVCTAGFEQDHLAMISDGAGGVFLAWSDKRVGGQYDIWATRILSNGAVAAGWVAQGTRITNTTGNEETPMLATDGAGGVFIVWIAPNNARDVYAARYTSAGVLAAPYAGGPLLVCNAANDQILPSVVADGSGNVIVSWYDYRGAPTNAIYAQKVLGSYGVAWAANGVALTSVAHPPYTQAWLTSDGAGGVFATWWLNETGQFWVRASRVLPAGSVWPLNGNTVFSGPDYTVVLLGNPISIVSDGAGGAYLAWWEEGTINLDVFVTRLGPGAQSLWAVSAMNVTHSSGGVIFPSLIGDGAGGAIVGYRGSGVDLSVYAQRLSPGGQTLWAAGGSQVAGVYTPLASQAQLETPALAATGDGGAVFIWRDNRNNYGAGDDLYAQRLDHFGYLGDPTPRIVSVRDVPNDQGGHIKLSWNASYLDAWPEQRLGEYRAWRSVPPALAQARIARGARLGTFAEVAAGADGRTMVAAASGTETTYWELVTTVMPSELSGYSLDVSTPGDSTPAGYPKTYFMVQAVAPDQVTIWSSPADSGYSVDNLAPAAPSPFVLVANGDGSATLVWNRNREPDVGEYRLYRGVGTGFVPDPTNLVATLTDTTWFDPRGTSYVFKIAAVDVHGNVSPYAIAFARGATGVPAVGDPQAVTLRGAWPNPIRGRGEIRYALPRPMPVELMVYDVAGRRVRLLEDGTRPAGENAVGWDGRDDDGHGVPVGLYLVRLRAGGRVEASRVVLAR